MRVLAGVSIALVLLTGQRDARPGLSKADGDRFQAKLERILAVGNLPRNPSRKPENIQITDSELNSYLRYNAQSQVPVGIAEPSIFANGEGIVSGSAVVDLDAVRKSRQRGWLDPLGYLSGRLPLTARGRLTTQNGVGRFQLDAAELSGVAIPKTLLQELLTYYSQTPDDPDGINMDDPFELPAQIREIKVSAGTATIVQ